MTKGGGWQTTISIFRYRPWRSLLLAAFFLLLPSASFANNLSISNVFLVDPDASTDTAKIQFSISWSNSWRNTTNRDAVWVFAKYTTNNAAPFTWYHCILKTSGTNPTGFDQGEGTSLNIVVPTDKRGAIIERSSTGSGSVSTDQMKLVWDYGASGVSDTASVMVRVFGIEMVYIPSGSFYLGDGNGSSESTYSFWRTNGNAFQVSTTQLTGVSCDSNANDDIDTTTVTIDGDGGISGNAGGAAAWTTATVYAVGNLVTQSSIVYRCLIAHTSGTFATDLAAGKWLADGNYNPQWPVGYDPFYLMKYEVTQDQYKDFLNTLSRAQQITRVASNVSGDSPTSGYVYVMGASATVIYRNTINCPASGNGTTNPITFSVTSGKGDRACNFPSWMDAAAFLDWAALRPMTETEYEKAARGPTAAVYGEFAGGTTAIVAASRLSGTEDGTETVSTVGANAVFGSVTFTGGDGGQGPLRVGIFATTTSTRREAGAGYYGNMELSGSVWEYAVTLGNSSGRAFVGSHGDGQLTTTTSYEGNATNTDWPGIDTTSATRGITGGTGIGLRGDNWNGTADYPVSARTYASNSAIMSNRGSARGIRGARNST